MRDIEITDSLLRDMSDVSDPQDLLRLFLVHAQGTFNVQRAIVLSREGLEYPQFRIVLYAECDGLRAGTTVEDQVIAGTGGLLADLLYAGRFCTLTPLVVDDVEPSHSLLGDCRALSAFPLYGHGEVVGMVVLLGPEDRRCNVAELCELAIMGSLLQRADRTYALTKQLEATCRSLDTELAAAASVQSWLLPPQTSSIPGVDIACFYRTALHCGGDYYDVGQLPDGNVGVLIADVSGHGAAAAVLMAILRTVVHDEVDRSHVASAAALLDHAHEHLHRIGLSSRGAFITAFSGSLNTKLGHFTYSCAGHPPPRLLRAAEGTVTPITGAGSPPLGVLDDRARHVEETIQLDPGDLVLFYSDGIFEARSPSGEFFGLARLDQILCDLPGNTSAAVAVQAVKQAVDAFSGPAAPSDDQTLLAIRWQPDRDASIPAEVFEANNWN